MHSLTKAAVKDLGGVLVSALIRFCENKETSWGKKTNRVFPPILRSRRGVNWINGRDFKAAVHHATSLLYCSRCAESETERNAASAASGGTAAS